MIKDDIFEAAINQLTESEYKPFFVQYLNEDGNLITVNNNETRRK